MFIHKNESDVNYQKDITNGRVWTSIMRRVGKLKSCLSTNIHNQQLKQKEYISLSEEKNRWVINNCSLLSFTQLN